MLFKKAAVVIRQPMLVFFFTLSAAATLLSPALQAEVKPHQLLQLNPQLLTLSMQATASRADVPFAGVALIAQGSQLLWHYQASPSALPLALPALSSLSQMTIASQSKQITAVLVLRAVEQQKIALDAPLAQYLPARAKVLEYKPLNQKEPGQQILIRHLLEHSAGFQSLTEAAKTPPGRHFAYSNAGYDVLGEVLSTVYQQPFASLAAALFQHCGMIQSFVPDSAQLTSKAPQLVPGFMEKNGVFVPAPLDVQPEFGPSGRMVSSGADLLRWMQCLHQTNLLSPRMHQMMVTAAQQRQHRWGVLGYGFGLQINKADHIIEWSHSGYVPGYISTTAYYPQWGLSLVLLEPLSLDGQDINRAFYFHDQLRLALRAQLLQNKK